MIITFKLFNIYNIAIICNAFLIHHTITIYYIVIN